MPRPHIDPERMSLLNEMVATTTDTDSFAVLARQVGLKRTVELTLVAAWLHLELVDAGCPSPQDRHIGRILGVRTIKEPDPWAAAVDLLRRWKMGLPLIPRAEAN